MEANKILGEAKSLKLDNGAEITYCERGENNKEVIVTGGFYFITFMPVLEALAKYYHVYGVVMRFDGVTDQLNPDGSIHWGKQWGKDIYDFTRKIGLEKFHYFGKCHGTIPGWWLYKNHPECMIDFCSFFLAPHLKPDNSHTWVNLLEGHDLTKMMHAALRFPEEGLPKKMAEMKQLGGDATNPAIFEYASEPQKLWDSPEECEADLKAGKLPIGYMFGSEDPLMADYYDSNMYAWKITKGCHFTIINGEKHLMEIDCPERVAYEALAFIDQARRFF